MKLFLAVTLLALAACKKDEIQVYKIAKPTEAPEAAAAPHAHEDHAAPAAGAGMGALPPEMSVVATAAPASLIWQAPAGWAAKPASGMRRATYLVSGAADMSVISLPGDAGGDLANVNRWRGQVGLEPWDAAAFKKAAETVVSRAGNFTMIDLAGSSQRMLAGMMMREGETWFFKLLGPDQLVGAAKPAFKSFLASVSPK